MNKKLYTKVKKIPITVRHVAEVGVYLPETSNILGFIEERCKSDLVEPDPLALEKIHLRFAGYDNVSIHPYAVYNERTILGLYRTNASTFVETLPASPALVNDNYTPIEEDRFEVETRLFSDLDDGTIDVLSIDTEGCEWYVLETMKSHPAVISLETHGKRYTNPFIDKIDEWIQRHSYKVWYRDKSDTVYIRGDIRLGFFDRWF